MTDQKKDTATAPLLPTIGGPADLAGLSAAQLERLAAEIARQSEEDRQRALERARAREAATAG